VIAGLVIALRDWVIALNDWRLAIGDLGIALSDWPLRHWPNAITNHAIINHPIELLPIESSKCRARFLLERPANRQILLVRIDRLLTIPFGEHARRGGVRR